MSTHASQNVWDSQFLQHCIRHGNMAARSLLINTFLIVIHETCIDGLIKNLSPYIRCISGWTAFALSPFAHRKQTEWCSLQDAFNGNIATFTVSRWRYSEGIVIKLTDGIQNNILYKTFISHCSYCENLYSDAVFLKTCLRNDSRTCSYIKITVECHRIHNYRSIGYSKKCMLQIVYLELLNAPRMIPMALAPQNWKRPPERPHITWLNTVQRDMRAYNLTLKQLTWPRTTLCGGWCHCMALRTPSGACKKEEKSKKQYHC